jgi:hypothetical protein
VTDSVRPEFPVLDAQKELFVGAPSARSGWERIASEMGGGGRNYLSRRPGGFQNSGKGYLNSSRFQAGFLPENRLSDLPANRSSGEEICAHSKDRNDF